MTAAPRSASCNFIVDLLLTRQFSTHALLNTVSWAVLIAKRAVLQQEFPRPEVLALGSLLDLRNECMLLKDHFFPHMEVSR